jgi:hypothetical protein
MDSVSLVRSLVSKEGDHERGTYLMKTGYRPDPTVMHPALGSIVTRELPVAGLDIPQFVSLGFNQFPSRGGYLGGKYDAFLVQNPEAGAKAQGAVQDYSLYGTSSTYRSEQASVILGNRTGDQQEQGRAIAHVPKGENGYQSLAWSRARLRAMEAAGNRHWLRREPAHYERERSNSDRLPARPLRRNWHIGHHRSRGRLCVAVD